MPTTKPSGKGAGKGPKKADAYDVKLVIYGRDGILNEYRDDHVKAPEEWVPIPGVLDALARLHQRGWHAVVATNQAGIGRGMIDMAAVNAIHAHMCRKLVEHGGRIDAVFFCPHTPEEHCGCRKPMPGMMRDIGARYGVSLADVPMVCDTLRDLEAAQAAGCEPHLVLAGRAAALDAATLARYVELVPRTLVHRDLNAFAEVLLRRDHVADSQSAELL